MLSPAESGKTPLPEERLLRLIRGKGRQAAPVAASSVTVSQDPPPPAARPAGKVTGRSVPWLQLISGGLGLILLAELGGIVFQLVQPLPVIEVTGFERPQPAGPALPLPTTPALSVHAGKPLFADPLPARVIEKPRGPSAEAVNLESRLSLVGIVDGDPPQAIIEDASTSKTHFVVEGQKVTEGAVVTEIHANRVVLDWFGEQIDLSL